MELTGTKPYRRMMSLLQKSGIMDRDVRISLVNSIIDYPVQSFTQLSEDDIDKIVEHFSTWERVQRERFNDGTLFLEAGMVRALIDSEGISPLSDSDTIPNQKSRKAFLRKMATPEYDVNESKYGNFDSFDDDFDTIMSTMKDIKATKLDVEGGRWSRWKLIQPPTASIGLTLGIGGIPRGKIVHLWGSRHSGKSMLAHHLIASAQNDNIPTILIDAEAAATGDFVSHLGADVEKLKVVRPKDLETLCTLLRKLAKSPALIIVDSIASSESSRELERNLTGGQSAMVGGNARLWASTLSIIRADLLENGGTLVLINQVRAKMDASQWEEKEKPFGSEAIQHQNDISIKVSRVKEKNDTLKKQGYHISRLRFDKNRFGGNTRNVDLAFKPGHPYNKSIDLVRHCGEEISQGSGVSYGEAADNSIVKGFIYDEQTGQLVPRQNRWTIRIDPTLMRAILDDDEDFEEVDVTPAEAVDMRNVPVVDVENSAYFTLPNVGELRAVTWLSKHPTARDVIIERLLDGLNKKRSYEGED